MNELLEITSTVMNPQLLQYVLLGVLGYVGILWIALIFWVTKDITNRTNSIVFQTVSILMLIVLTPLFGLPLYLVIRPPRTLMERYFENVEQDMIEQYYASMTDTPHTEEGEKESTQTSEEIPPRPPKGKKRKEKEAPCPPISKEDPETDDLD